jgi:hypothetical protein
VSDSTEQPPAPETCHPALTGLAGSVRNALDRDSSMHQIRYPVLRSPRFVSREIDPVPSSIGYSVRTMTVSKAVAPAPFVGDPFVYMWKVATDDLGRHVAGSSWIEYVPRWSAQWMRLNGMPID